MICSTICKQYTYDNKLINNKQPVHGDLDTVIGLVEQHKNFEEELNSRTEQVEQLKQTAEENEDAIKIRDKVTELTGKCMGSQ